VEGRARCNAARADVSTLALRSSGSRQDAAARIASDVPPRPRARPVARRRAVPCAGGAVDHARLCRHGDDDALGADRARRAGRSRSRRGKRAGEAPPRRRGDARRGRLRAQPPAHRARARHALPLSAAGRGQAGRRARHVRHPAALAVPHRSAGARGRVRVVRLSQRPLQPARAALGRRLRDLRRDRRARARSHALARRQRVFPRAGVDLARGDERALPRVPRDPGAAPPRTSRSGTTTTSARTTPTARSR
jgi:hypothetical protein